MLMDCDICGTLFDSTNKRRTCSKGCHEIRNKNQQKAWRSKDCVKKRRQEIRNHRFKTDPKYAARVREANRKQSELKKVKRRERDQKYLQELARLKKRRLEDDAYNTKLKERVRRSQADRKHKDELGFKQANKESRLKSKKRNAERILNDQAYAESVRKKKENKYEKRRQAMQNDPDYAEKIRQSGNRWRMAKARMQFEMDFISLAGQLAGKLERTKQDERSDYPK